MAAEDAHAGWGPEERGPRGRSHSLGERDGSARFGRLRFTSASVTGTAPGVTCLQPPGTPLLGPGPAGRRRATQPPRMTSIGCPGVKRFCSELASVTREAVARTPSKCTREPSVKRLGLGPGRQILRWNSPDCREAPKRPSVKETWRCGYGPARAVRPPALRLPARSSPQRAEGTCLQPLEPSPRVWGRLDVVEGACPRSLTLRRDLSRTPQPRTWGITNAIRGPHEEGGPNRRWT